MSFWFGALDEAGAPEPEVAKRWFRPTPALDAEMAERFGDRVGEALERRIEGWKATSRGRLALVLLLDQFTRNVYRSSARAFAGDARALAIAREGIDVGEDRALRTIERSFLYLPFMHAENLRDQDRSVALFASLCTEASPELRPRVEASYEFALSHREAIRRFGRFPARNEILGRRSTPEEQAFLVESPAGF